MTVKMVKSVKRTMEILELFDRERRPLSAGSISEKLGYPLASTHEILKTLHNLDYFDYGRPKWAYTPSRKFVSIIDWVQDATSEYDRLLDFMVALNNDTKETINLSRNTSFETKIIKGYECLHHLGVSSIPGTTMPVTQSLTGIVGLSGLSDNDLENYLANISGTDPQQFASIDHKLLSKVINEVRTTGISLECDLRIEGIGALCFPVVSESTQAHLVIGIVGPSGRIREYETEHRKTIKRLSDKFRINTAYPIVLN